MLCSLEISASVLRAQDERAAAEEGGGRLVPVGGSLEIPSTMESL